MSASQADRDRRLAFAIPPIAEPAEEIQWLDAADADARALLIAAAHPEFDTEAGTVLVGGDEVAPRLHLAIHGGASESCVRGEQRRAAVGDRVGKRHVWRAGVILPASLRHESSAAHHVPRRQLGAV